MRASSPASNAKHVLPRPRARQERALRYIEGCCHNPHRRHSRIGRRSPANFEKTY